MNLGVEVTDSECKTPVELLNDFIRFTEEEEEFLRERDTKRRSYRIELSLISFG